jgi:Fic family protein
MQLSPNLILQLHRDLMRYSGTGGKWQAADNLIKETLPNGETLIRFKPVPAWQTADAIEELCQKFNMLLDLGDLPDILLISTFVLDFLCIHPFPDGNGRIGRLLTLLLLYQCGYVVGRYISLERVIEDNQERYYDTLHDSSQGWHDGEHNILPWTEYFLTMLLEAYHRFEERIGNVERAQKKGWKQERIREVVDGFLSDFTISDIEESCPGISRPTVTRVLNELSKNGNVECIQRGRNAKWVRRTRIT